MITFNYDFSMVALYTVSLLYKLLFRLVEKTLDIYAVGLFEQQVKTLVIFQFFEAFIVYLNVFLFPNNFNRIGRSASNWHCCCRIECSSAGWDARIRLYYCPNGCLFGPGAEKSRSIAFI